MDIENLGGGAALKLVRFLKNVKNFGSLSLMGKLRTAAVPVVPAALFGVSAVGGSLQAASISETLQIGPLQQVMMQDCIDNHDDIARCINLIWGNGIGNMNPAQRRTEPPNMKCA